MDIVGSQQIGYEATEQMLKMVAVRKQLQRDSGRMQFVWCLKRDNSDVRMLQRSFPKVFEKGLERMESAVDQSGLRQYDFGHHGDLKEIIGGDEMKDDAAESVSRFPFVSQNDDVDCIKSEDDHIERDRNHNRNVKRPQESPSESPTIKNMEDSTVKKEEQSESQKSERMKTSKQSKADLVVKEEEKEEDPERVAMRRDPRYSACLKFFGQKLNKNKVLLRSEMETLIRKYSKKHTVLKDMSGDIIDLVVADSCWVIREDRYCLREISELTGGSVKREYNEHRKKIVDWFNSSRNRKRVQVKDRTAKKQFKGLAIESPDDETHQIIMRSICDWNEETEYWCLKSGLRIKKK